MSDALDILIVEDEALLAMELESLIEDSGHRVAGWATSSREANELLKTVHADLALVDIHLADGPTGVDVAERIKSNGAMVVFMTANPKRIPDDFSGAIGVIAKPYTMSGFLAALRYLEEGVRRPPPLSALPTGFTLSPDFTMNWVRPTDGKR